MRHLRISCLVYVVALMLGCQSPRSSLDKAKEPSNRSVLLNYGAVKSEACDPDGEPEIQAVYAGQGNLVWEDSQGFPARGDIFESVELRGRNLCNANFKLGVGLVENTAGHTHCGSSISNNCQ